MFDFLFGDKAKALFSLFVGSFKLLGEENVRALLMRRAMFSVAVHLLAILGLVMICFHLHAGWGWFLLVLLGLMGYPYSFFYHVRARARQTWFAYAKITNHTNPIAEASAMVAKQKWRLRTFAFIELSLGNAAAQSDGQQSGGVFRMFVAVALAALNGLYEIAEDYLLPAIVIDRLSFTEAAPKLRQLKDNLPQGLAGSFGLDVFGGVISSVLFLFSGGLVLLGALLMWGLPKAHLVSPMYTFNMTNANDGSTLALFLFPLLAAIVLASLMHRLVKILVSSMQATYFAIFYTRVNHPNELPPEEQAKVDEYLQLPAAS